MFKIGDRVELVTDRHGVREDNPLKGTVFACVGTVDRVTDTKYGSLSIGVQWDNGKHNSYSQADLKSFVKDFFMIKLDEILGGI